MATAMLTISAPANAAGIRELRAQVDELERQFQLGLGGTPAPAAEGVHDAVRLYQRTAPASRSREVLELLPGGKANAVTPEELAQLMASDKSGAKLKKASARAAIRVVQRVTTKAIREGAIGREIIEIDFSGYDQEGAGRYYVSEKARAAIDSYLKGVLT
jgi:hypothetical protein